MNNENTEFNGEVRPALGRVEPKVNRSWHEAYIEMQSDPLDNRTDVQFCESIDLNYQTFVTWKRTYRTYIFKEVDHRRKNYVNEMRTIGHKALAKKLDKDTNAIKLLFQLLGDLVEKSEIKTGDLQHDDKVRRLATLMGSAGKRQKEWEAAAKDLDSSIKPEGSSGPEAPKSGGAD